MRGIREKFFLWSKVPEFCEAQRSYVSLFYYNLHIWTDAFLLENILLLIFFQLFEKVASREPCLIFV